MKRVQIKLIKEASVADMEAKANDFLRDLMAHNILHTAVRDGVVVIIYREEMV